MRSTSLLLLAIAAIFIAPPAQADQQNRLASGEIIVTTEAAPNSSMPIVRVTGVIDAPPEAIWEIVSQCERYPGRMPRIKEGRELSRDGSTVVCEVVVGLPFPLKDLKATSRSVHTVGPPEWRREWTLIEGDYERNDGSWVLRRFNGDDQRTLAIYTVHAEPHSSIPAGLRRRAQESSMPEIIERLRELTEKK